jgi:two-component sensor histidine kinase
MAASIRECQQTMISDQNIPPHQSENERRASAILNAIMSYARLDFSSKIPISDKNDTLDAISIGVNMLGEELQSNAFSLKEKDQIIREVHHRVKNNLQIIASIFNLQAENSNNADFKDLIFVGRNRIKSIALVHEMLYTSLNPRSVNIKEYVQTLVYHIHHSLSKPGAKITLHYDFQDDHFLNTDQIISIGLVINEAVTNSIKYAFPDGNGTISISFSKALKKFKLEIEDNGIGFSDQKTEGTGLGTQLISLLVMQIEGQLKTKSDSKGTAYIISFDAEQ